MERELPELCKDTNMKTHIFRPGYFFPSKDYPDDRLNQRGSLERAADVLMTPLFSTLLPSSYTPINEFGPFTLEILKGRWPQQELFRNAEMRKLMKTPAPAAAST